MNEWTSIERTCLDCPATLWSGNKSGRCRLCFPRFIARSPEVAARKSAALKRYCADPANKAAIIHRSKRAADTRLANPDYRAWLSGYMRDVVQPKSDTSSELGKKRASANQHKGVEARMAWCPVEYRDTHRALIRAGIKKAEAVPMIADMIAAAKRRAANTVAALSPFERQMADLEAKVKLGEAALMSNDMFRRRAA